MLSMIYSILCDVVSINEFQISISELKTDQPMCKTLEDILKSHGVGDFKKADFAKKMANILQKDYHISDELVNIITRLKNL